MSVAPRRIAILGFGLIGSSLARALSQHKGVHIAAFDLSHDALLIGTKAGFVHSRHAHAGEAAQDANIVVLAAPPAALATLAADIAPFLGARTVVTDTASIKREAAAAILSALPKHTHYVPGHPIAGSEQTGAAAGRSDLFAGKRVILSPEEADLKSEPVARVRMLWEAVGARVEFMPADLHDRIYAYVSHMPQLVAHAARQPMEELPSLRDEASLRFARLMRSDIGLWADICLANADYVGEAVEDFLTFARQIEGELREEKTQGGSDANQVARLFPQVVATCLIATASLLQEVTGVHPARYAGTGFADMTAPAVSDPEAALDAISSHHWVIAKLLGMLLARLAAARMALIRKDRQGLIAALS